MEANILTTSLSSMAFDSQRSSTSTLNLGSLATSFSASVI